MRKALRWQPPSAHWQRAWPARCEQLLCLDIQNLRARQPQTCSAADARAPLWSGGAARSGLRCASKKQEAACEAVRLGASALLVAHLSAAGQEAATLACAALARLAAGPAGRAALANAGGIGTLAAALRGPAESHAAACLEVGAPGSLQPGGESL